jgi:hypothetical protein
MSITLTTTISGETSNSYCDVDFADDYFENHYDITKTAAWDELGDGQKEHLLVRACRMVEMARFTEPEEPMYYNYQMRWRRDLGQVISIADRRHPYKYSSIQSLQFPRNLDVRSDGTVFIPEEVKMAQCEQAVYLLNLDETALANRLQGIRRDTVVVNSGDITLSQAYEPGGTLFGPLTLELIRPYLLKSGTRIERA